MVWLVSCLVYIINFTKLDPLQCTHVAKAKDFVWYLYIFTKMMSSLNSLLQLVHTLDHTYWSCEKASMCDCKKKTLLPKDSHEFVCMVSCIWLLMKWTSPSVFTAKQLADIQWVLPVCRNMLKHELVHRQAVNKKQAVYYLTTRKSSTECIILLSHWEKCIKCGLLHLYRQSNSYFSIRAMRTRALKYCITVRNAPCCSAEKFFSFITAMTVLQCSG